MVRSLRIQSKTMRLRAPVAPPNRALRSLFRLDVDIHICPCCCPVSSLRRCARTPATTSRSATTQWPLAGRQFKSHARARPTDRPTDRPPARPPVRPPDRPTERPARKNRHGGCFMLGKDWVGVLKIRMSMRRTPPVVIPALLVGAYERAGLNNSCSGCTTISQA